MPVDVRELAKRLTHLEQITSRTMYTWQRDFIFDQSPINHLRCGRKSGKTDAAAFKVNVDWQDYPDEEVLIVSATKQAADELFYRIKGIAHLSGIESEEDRRTKFVFPNGHVVTCLPAGRHAVSLRPKSVVKLYEDEAPLMLDDVHEGLTPCLAARGAQNIMMGTPWDENGFFFRTEQQIEHSIVAGRHWHIKTSTCPHIPAAFLERERRRLGADAYAREYDAEYGRAVNQMIADPIIYSSIHPMIEAEELKAPAIFIGVDFARAGRDDNAIAWCAYWPLLNQAHLFRVEIIPSDQRLTAMSGRLACYAEENKNVRKIVTDAGGLGQGPTDFLADRLGPGKVIGLKNQSQVKDGTNRIKFLKEDMYSKFQVGLEQKILSIDDNAKMISAIKGIRYKYSENGKYLLIYGRNDHAMEAMVRAYWPVTQGMGGLGCAPEIHFV